MKKNEKKCKKMQKSSFRRLLFSIIFHFFVNLLGFPGRLQQNYFIFAFEFYQFCSGVELGFNQNLMFNLIEVDYLQSGLLGGVVKQFS